MSNSKKMISEAMRDYFRGDEKRINHALKVLKYAEMIQGKEGGELLIIQLSAILHDIGIHEAERKHNSSAGIYQEIEGPDVAKKILKAIHLSTDDVNHICEIIKNHHSDKGISSIEFKIVWDADRIINIEEEMKLNNKEKIEIFIKKVFKTQTGKIIAINKFINTNN